MITDSINDEELMAELKKGNYSAAGVLFERYHQNIFGFLIRMSSEKDLSEDLTQNVFLRVIKYKNSFKPSQRFRPWVFQIARNLFYDHVKEEKKMRKTDITEKEFEIESISDEGSRKEEELKLLNQALQKLSEEERVILVLNRFEKIKYKEIGEMLDLSLPNVKVKAHRAVLKLKDIYLELEKSQSHERS